MREVNRFVATNPQIEPHAVCGIPPAPQRSRPGADESARPSEPSEVSEPIPSTLAARQVIWLRVKVTQIPGSHRTPGRQATLAR